MKGFLNLLIITSVFTFASGFSLHKKTIPNGSAINCEIMHNGVFVYGDDDENRIVIKGNKHTEYSKNAKHYIKSEITWVNDCECNVKIIKTTVPNFPYKKGTVMNIQINNVKGNMIMSTITVGDDTWPSILKKVK